MTEIVYYRRLQGYPATHPDQVEVTADRQSCGCGDSSWHEAHTDRRAADDLGLTGSLSECCLLADALIIYRALLDSGLMTEEATWHDSNWTPYDYDQLDRGRAEYYEALCRSLQLLSPPDAAEQARRLVETAPDTEHGRKVREQLSAWLAPRWAVTADHAE